MRPSADANGFPFPQLGRRRALSPACARAGLGYKLRHGGRNGLARYLFASENAAAFALCALCLCVLFLLFAFLWRNESARDFSPYILSPAIVPIFIALSRFLQTKNKIYELTSERLKITEGVFNKVTDTLELYRVKDLETRQPFWERAFGVENVQINTTDVSTPFILIEAVSKKIGLGDKIRNAVENVRMQKRVRELDIE